MCWKTPVGFAQHANVSALVSSPICPGNGGNEQSLSTYHSDAFMIHVKKSIIVSSLFGYLRDAFCFPLSLSIRLYDATPQIKTKHTRSTLALLGRDRRCPQCFRDVFTARFWGSLGSFQSLRNGVMLDSCESRGDDLMTCMSRMQCQRSWFLCSILAGKSHPYMYIMYIYIYKYSHPQTDEKVIHHQISRDLLFHLFGDDYIYIYLYIWCLNGKMIYSGYSGWPCSITIKCKGFKRNFLPVVSSQFFAAAQQAGYNLTHLALSCRFCASSTYPIDILTYLGVCARGREYDGIMYNDL